MRYVTWVLNSYLRWNKTKRNVNISLLPESTMVLNITLLLLQSRKPAQRQLSADLVIPVMVAYVVRFGNKRHRNLMMTTINRPWKTELDMIELYDQIHFYSIVFQLIVFHYFLLCIVFFFEIYFISIAKVLMFCHQ